MDVTLIDLWLPVLLASIAVFVASAVIWMLLPHHKADIRFMPNEDAFTGAIGPLNIQPGLYMYPNCQDPKDFKSEDFKKRFEQGPWGVITVFPKQPSFAMNLLRTYLSYLAITAVIAYIASLGLGRDAAYMQVFQISASAGILGYCMGGLANDFFLGKPTRFIITSFIDGIFFALITAGIFASMWPGPGGSIPEVPGIG